MSFSTLASPALDFDGVIKIGHTTDELFPDLPYGIEARLEVEVEFEAVAPGDYWTPPAGGCAQVTGWELKYLVSDESEISHGNPLYELCEELIEPYLDEYIQKREDRLIQQAVDTFPEPPDYY